VPNEYGPCAVLPLLVSVPTNFVCQRSKALYSGIFQSLSFSHVNTCRSERRVCRGILQRLSRSGSEHDYVGLREFGIEFVIICIMSSRSLTTVYAANSPTTSMTGIRSTTDYLQVRGYIFFLSSVAPLSILHTILLVVRPLLPEPFRTFRLLWPSKSGSLPKPLFMSSCTCHLSTTTSSGPPIIPKHYPEWRERSSLCDAGLLWRIRKGI
jgi:hypothetical protein